MLAARIGDKTNFHQLATTQEPCTLFCSGLTSSGREDDTNNESIQSQSLSKNQNKNHSNKQLWLLGIGSANKCTEKLNQTSHILVIAMNLEPKIKQKPFAIKIMHINIQGSNQEKRTMIISGRLNVIHENTRSLYSLATNQTSP